MRNDIASTGRRLPWILCLALAACATPQPGDPAPACGDLTLQRPDGPLNVILIINDTMRADRVGIYGGPARTPAFDAFARDHFYVDQVYTQAPWTKPSMATLFTSLYPSQHRVASHPELRQRAGVDVAGHELGEVDTLSDGFQTLPEVMRDAGYATAAFVSNPWMGRDFGFDQGFDVYDDSFADWDAPGATISRAGLDWLEQHGDGGKFFLYLHYIDSHQPYGALDDEDIEANLERLEAVGGRSGNKAMAKLYDWTIHLEQQRFSPETIERLEAIGPSRLFFEMVYDRGIEDFDEALATFLEGFADHPDFERTAIIITSDHGEALYDRGYASHGLGLYDDEAAIPFAARLPGVSARQSRVECAVGLIDLMPTLCNYLAVDCPQVMFGRSFLDGPGNTSGYVVTEGVMFRPRNRSLRNRTYKLLWEPDGAENFRATEYSLFDVANDPLERRDLLSARFRSPEFDEIAEAMKHELQPAVPPFDAPDEAFAPMSPELEERLKALGYLD